MGTIVWGKLRVFAAVMLVIAVVSGTTMIGCGGGEGSSDGHLCEQCGETDGPCISPEVLPATDDDLPAFCEPGKDCTVSLRCVRKIDSGQRRCFPGDPEHNNALDVDFECDGSRPEPVPSPTLTPTATPIPTFTGPTVTPSATAVTPTPTLTPSATAVTPTPTPSPQPTTTPDASVIPVGILVEDPNDDDFTTFTARVTYPPAKGSFLLSGTADCDETDNVTFTDDGNGTLTVRFSAPADESDFSIDVECRFQAKPNQSLAENDLSGSVGNGLTITITIDL